MTDVDATLQAEDVGGGLRELLVGDPSGDFGVDTTGAAKEATLLLLLAKILTAPATEAKQDVLNLLVDGVEGSLTSLVAKDFATQTTLAAVLARLPSALDGGSLDVADVFTGGEALADQTGDGTAKTFTFSAPVDLVWVRCAVAGRADPFGGVPTSSAGIPCAADEPNPISVRTSSIKVLSASGSISCWGFR